MGPHTASIAPIVLTDRNCLNNGKKTTPICSSYHKINCQTEMIIQPRNINWNLFQPPVSIESGES